MGQSIQSKTKQKQKLVFGNPFANPPPPCIILFVGDVVGVVDVVDVIGVIGVIDVVDVVGVVGVVGVIGVVDVVGVVGVCCWCCCWCWCCLCCSMMIAIRGGSGGWLVDRRFQQV